MARGTYHRTQSTTSAALGIVQPSTLTHDLVLYIRRMPLRHKDYKVFLTSPGRVAAAGARGRAKVTAPYILRLHRFSGGHTQIPPGVRRPRLPRRPLLTRPRLFLRSLPNPFPPRALNPRVPSLEFREGPCFRRLRTFNSTRPRTARRTWLRSQKDWVRLTTVKSRIAAGIRRNFNNFLSLCYAHVITRIGFVRRICTFRSRRGGGVNLWSRARRLVLVIAATRNPRAPLGKIPPTRQNIRLLHHDRFPPAFLLIPSSRHTPRVVSFVERCAARVSVAADVNCRVRTTSPELIAVLQPGPPAFMLGAAFPTPTSAVRPPSCVFRKS